MRERQPIPRKRPTPRRNEGRVQHSRTKPKAGADPTAEELRHIVAIRKMPCIVPNCGMPATVHHVTGFADRAGRIARSHRRVVPLCNHAPHHQAVYDDASNPRSVEGLGHRGFFQRYKVDLLAEADRLWRERGQ